MSKRVYTLKHVPWMNIHHMREMMAFKADLAEKQEVEAACRAQAEGLAVCQQVRDLLTQEDYNAWWESAPEHGFFDAARAKLAELRTLLQPEGTEPSPIISGGEVLYTYSTPSETSDDSIPF